MPPRSVAPVLPSTEQPTLVKPVAPPHTTPANAVTTASATPSLRSVPPVEAGTGQITLVQPVIQHPTSAAAATLAPSTHMSSSPATPTVATVGHVCLPTVPSSAWQTTGHPSPHAVSGSDVSLEIAFQLLCKTLLRTQSTSDDKPPAAADETAVSTAVQPRQPAPARDEPLRPQQPTLPYTGATPGPVQHRDDSSRNTSRSSRRSVDSAASFRRQPSRKDTTVHADAFKSMFSDLTSEHASSLASIVRCCTDPIRTTPSGKNATPTSILDNNGPQQRFYHRPHPFRYICGTPPSAPPASSAAATRTTRTTNPTPTPVPAAAPATAPPTTVVNSTHVVDTGADNGSRSCPAHLSEGPRPSVHGRLHVARN